MKYLITLIVATLMVFFMVFGCSTEPGRNVSNNTRNRTQSARNNSGSRTSNRSRTSSVTLDCALPKECSGSDCCEDDDDCEDQCDDWFSGKAEKECLKLSQEDVDEIDTILEILKDAKEDELDDIRDDSVDLLCAILDDLDHKAWLTEVSRYTTAKAKRVLAWMIDDNNVTALLDSIDSEDAVEIMKRLISRAKSGTAGTAPQDILNGLDVGIGDDNDRVLVFADDANNEEFIEWIHENIVEEEICTSNVLPACVDSGTPTGVTTACSGSVSTGTKITACKLGVYCKVIPTSTEEDTRASVAEIIGDSDIEDLIETDQKTDGTGLNSADHLDEDDAEEWTNKACTRLEQYWNNGNNLDLDLGS